MTLTTADPADPASTPAAAPAAAGVAAALTAVEAPSQQAAWLLWLERKLRLTTSGLVVTGGCISGWVLGRVIQSRGVLLLVYGAAFVLIVSWLLGRRKLNVVASRSDLPGRVRPGQIVTVDLELTAKRRVATIVLAEEMDRHLGTGVRLPVPLLPAGETVAHSYAFTPRQRGVYSVGPLVAEWNDPFGLTRSRLPICDKAEIIVHPVVESPQDRITSREWEDPPVRPPVFKPWPTGFEFYGMREYVEGDDPRRIVWRALAQYDKYMVKESEQGITDRVNILLDTDRTAHSPGETSETFETAVRVAASLAIRHLRDGFGVKVHGNGDDVTPAHRGVSRQIPVLDALARVGRESATLAHALDRLVVDPQRHAHNVIVTTSLSSPAASRVRLLVDRGITVLLVLVVWDETDAMTVHRAGSLGCSVVEVHAGQPIGRVFDHVVRGRR